MTNLENPICMAAVLLSLISYGLPAGINLTYKQNKSDFIISWVTPSSLNIRSFCVNVTTSYMPPVILVSQCDLNQSAYSYQLQFSVRCIPINIILLSIDHVGIARTSSMLYDSCSESCRTSGFLAICEDPPPPVDGYIGSYYTTENNSVVTYWCDPGNYLFPPISFSTCTNSGLWVPEPAFTKCLPVSCNTLDNQTTQIISGIKFKAVKDAALVVMFGLILFITGAVVVTLSMLLMLQIYVRGKYIKRSSRVRSCNMDKKLNLNVDSGVQRGNISGQHENPWVDINIEMDRSSYGHDNSDNNGSDNNGSDAKYSSTNGRRSYVKSHITNTNSCSDSKFDKLVKDLCSSDTKNIEGSCHDPTHKSSS